jgi:ribosomal protein S18 acetylase RimI-like enzyme
VATGPELALRPIDADDRGFLFEVYASTREEELAPVPWSDAEKQAFLRLQFDAQQRYYQAQFPGAAFDVVLCSGRPVGRFYVARGRDEIRVLDIALLPSARGAGLGSALLGALLAEAQRAVKPIRMHVERFNRARRLYWRLGFATVGDAGVYLLLEWRPEGAPLTRASG